MIKGIPILDLYDNKSEKYINGECAILALTLNELYENFILVGIFSSEKQQEYPTKGLLDKDYTYQHYLVLIDIPNIGIIYIDAEGVWDKENLLKHWKNKDFNKKYDFINMNILSMKTIKYFIKDQKIGYLDYEYAINILYRISKVFKLPRESFRKLIDLRELNFIKLNEDIHPKYTIEKINSKQAIIKMEKYPMTLRTFNTIVRYSENDQKEFPKSNGVICKISEKFDNLDQILDYFYTKVDDMIDIIHSRNMIHGDLHSDNVIVDPETGDCKIIDFGRSYFIKELNDDKILKLGEFMGSQEPFTSLNQLMAYEHIMYR